MQVRYQQENDMVFLGFKPEELHLVQAILTSIVGEEHAQKLMDDIEAKRRQTVLGVFPRVVGC